MIKFSGNWLNINTVLIVALPFIMLAANDEWLFPYGHPSDAWINYSFYLNDGDQFPELYQTYKASRVSWLSKGHFLHSFLAPLTAHYVLHISMFIAILLTFYRLVLELFDHHTAFVAAIALGTYSQFHGTQSFEWDYQAHDGTLHMLLAILALCFAAKRTKWQWWLIGAGAAWSVALQATYIATYIPAVVVWYLYLNHQHRRNPIIRSGIFILIGAIAMTAFMGLVSMSMGGNFFFVYNIFHAAQVFGTSGNFNFHSGYWYSLTDLLKFRLGIILPIIVFGISATLFAWLAVKRSADTSAQSIKACLLLYLAAFSCALVFHFIGHGQLSNDHILAFIIPFSFIALAATYGFCLSCKHERFSEPNSAKALFKFGTAAVFISGLYCGPYIWDYVAPRVDALNRYFVEGLPTVPSIQVLSVFILAGLPAVYCIVFRPIPFPGWVASAGLTLFLVFTNLTTSLLDIRSYALPSIAPQETQYRKEQFRATIETYEKLRPYFENHDVRQWYTSDEKTTFHPSKKNNGQTPAVEIDMAELYGAVLGLRGYTVIPPPSHRSFFLVNTYLSSIGFDRIDSQTLGNLPANFYVATMSNDEENVVRATNTLVENGFDAHITDSFDIDHGPIFFNVDVLKVRRNDRARAEGRLQP